MFIHLKFCTIVFRQMTKVTHDHVSLNTYSAIELLSSIANGIENKHVYGCCVNKQWLTGKTSEYDIEI